MRPDRTAPGAVTGGAIEHGSAYRSQDFRAAAFWLPSGVSPDDEALAEVMQKGVAVAL
ncbi:MAG: hypothetical protein JKY00_12915 [Roseicyclus sp.]|nr:hypothetical protein [Roseicyclus sp.]